VDDIEPAGALVQRIVHEAETIIRDRAELVRSG